MAFYVTVVTFGVTLLMNKWLNIVMNDGKSLSVGQNPSLVSKLWWNIVTHDWHLDEKLRNEWQFLQRYKSIIPQTIYKEWHNNVGLTSSVGNTLHRSLRLLLSKTIIIGDT